MFEAAALRFRIERRAGPPRAGVAQVEPAEAGEGLAVAAGAGRHHAVEHVDAARAPTRRCRPACRRPSDSAACPSADAARRSRSCAASRPAARRPRGRRWRSPRSRCATSSLRALDAQPLARRRPARCRTAPCPAGRRRRLRQRSAQRSDRRIAFSATSSAHGSCTHSSSCIWMSAPSRPWISIERSGRQHVASSRRYATGR